MTFGFANPFRSNTPAIGHLPAGQAVQMASDGGLTLVDVRDHSELAQTGKARGAIHIPLFQLNHKADPRHPECHPELKTDKPVAVYCATGARSQMAGRAMAKLGFTQVYNIGGLSHWQSAGGACEAA